jgi:exopolysaccharide biosynthesis polyprenyl glycosylphosphotransferase
LPGNAQTVISRLVADLHDLPVRVWAIPDYFTLALNRASIEELAGIPMINLRAPAISDDARMIKRIFDITLCVLLIPILLPLMSFIALAIRLDSPGPIIFKQKRVGENGKLFNMVKFRSMVPDAEEQRNLIETVDSEGILIQNKNPEDPRITRVGRFLRRTSLDEIPQVFNVLKGEMSFVGPRPELPYLVEKYEPWQRKRFGVPQGMTGWWQIHGRSDKPLYLHTEDDLFYVQNYSLWLDIKILIRTVIVVLQRKGAY